MTGFWINIVATLVIIFITTYSYTGRLVFERPYYRAQEAEKERKQVWSSLTEADRQWFQANLWDGKKVLDERPEPPKPLPVVPSGPALFCAHPNTVTETSIQDAGVRLICTDCGLTWVEDWDTWIED